MHGRGVFNYANGDVYKGEYFGGKQEGQGTFTWKNGDRYVGAVSEAYPNLPSFAVCGIFIQTCMLIQARTVS